MPYARRKTYPSKFGKSKSATTRRAPYRRTPYKRSTPSYRPQPLNTIVRAVEKKLATSLYGPKQSQVAVLSGTGGLVPVRDNPIAVNMSNFNTSSAGPAFYNLDKLLTEPNIKARWTRAAPYNHQTETDPSYDNHIVNGPQFYPLGFKLEFQIKGFVDNTHVRFDLIRCKHLITHGGVAGDNIDYTYMPKALFNMQGLAGFNLGRIPPNFEILQTKKVFMNSKPKTSLADATLESYPTTTATTTDTKYCTMSHYWPHGSSIKQFDTSTNEQTGAEPNSFYLDGVSGAYSWRNTDPRDQIWLVMSTDDETAWDAALTGDEVSIHVIRTCYWRDRLD